MKNFPFIILFLISCSTGPHLKPYVHGDNAGAVVLKWGHSHNTVPQETYPTNWAANKSDKEICMLYCSRREIPGDAYEYMLMEMHRRNMTVNCKGVNND